MVIYKLSPFSNVTETFDGDFRLLIFKVLTLSLLDMEQ